MNARSVPTAKATSSAQRNNFHFAFFCPFCCIDLAVMLAKSFIQRCPGFFDLALRGLQAVAWHRSRLTRRGLVVVDWSRRVCVLLS